MYVAPPLEKFLARKIMPIPECGCLIWMGATRHRTGYGIIHRDGREYQAHRVAYELAKGPIPKGLVIDHKCRVRSCINPDHLRAVTPRVNSLENSISPSAQNAKKSHCKRGHALMPGNLVNWSNPNKSSGKRTCLVCHSLRQKKCDDARAAARREAAQRTAHIGIHDGDTSETAQ